MAAQAAVRAAEVVRVAAARSRRAALAAVVEGMRAVDLTEAGEQAPAKVEEARAVAVRAVAVRVEGWAAAATVAAVMAVEVKAAAVLAVLMVAALREAAKEEEMAAATAPAARPV